MFIPDKEASSTINLQFRAKNQAGIATEWSQTFSIGLPSGPTPAAPTGNTVAFSGGSFILDWTASTAVDVTGYRINASHATAGSKDYFVSKDQTSWTLSSAENDTAFTGAGPKEAITFTVYAQGSGGTESSGLAFGLQTYPTMTGTITESCVPSVDTLTYFWGYPATNSDIVAYTRVVIDDNSDCATPTDTKDSYGNTVAFQVTSGSRYSKATIYDIFGRTLASAIIGPHTPAVATADTTPPASPTSPTLGSQSTTTSGNARITLTLTPPTDSDLAGYYVRYSTVDGSNWTYQNADATTTNPTTQAIVVTGLVPSTTYYFQAAAYDKAGNVSTSYTASVSAATNAIPTIETPTGALTSTWSGGDLYLSWTDPQTYGSHFAGYTVDINGARWQTVERNFTLTAEENIARLGTDASFAAGDIDIYARDIYGRLSASPISNGSTVLNDVPAAPATLSLSSISKAISATWSASASTDIKDYKLYVRLGTDAALTTGDTYLFYRGLGTSAVFPTNAIATDRYYAAVKSVDTLNQLSSTSAVANILDQAVAASDGSAPSSSPAATATAGVRSIHVTWPVISNADPVTYDIHLSTSNGFTPSASTLVGSTPGLYYLVTMVNGGALLAYGQQYYVKIIAKDVDGSAAAGTQGSATPIQAGTTDISDDSITTGKIAANTILAGDIAAGAITATAITASAITTQHLSASSITADKFAATMAFISQMTIGSAGWIRSSNYVPGSTGFSLEASSANAEFDSIIARKTGTIGGWNILKNDILSTGDSVRAVYLPGTTADYLVSNSTDAIAATATVDFIARIAPRNNATSGAAGERRVLAQRHAGTTGAHIYTFMLNGEGKPEVAIGATPTYKYQTTATAITSANGFADGEFLWFRGVINANDSTAYTTNGVSVAANSTRFYYGTSGGAPSDSLNVPSTWSPLSNDIATSEALLTSAAYTYLGWSTATTTKPAGSIPFTGQISDAYAYEGAALEKYIRVSDINRASTPNATTDFSMVGSIVGISASAIPSYVPNGSFYSGTTGWVATATGTATRNTSNFFVDGASLYIGATSGQGAETYVPGIATTQRQSTGYTKTLTLSRAHQFNAGDIIDVSGLTANYAGTNMVVVNANFGTTTLQYTHPTVSNSETTTADVTGIASPSFNTKIIVLEPNKRYILSFKRSGGEIQAKILFYDINHAYIANKDITYTTTGYTAPWVETGSQVFVSPSDAYYAAVQMTATSAVARYIDTVRIDTGDVLRNFGSAYSVMDSIRMEASGSLNVVNRYGRIDITNRQEIDDTINVTAGGLVGYAPLAPTIKLVPTDQGGSPLLPIPGELTIDLAFDEATGLAIPSSAATRVTSGSLYYLPTETDIVLRARKERAASITLSPNVVSTTGPLTGDTDPQTKISMSADNVAIGSVNIGSTGDITGAGNITGGVIEGALMVVNGTPLDTPNIYGNYTSYPEFEGQMLNNATTRFGEQAIVDGRLYTYNIKTNNIWGAQNYAFIRNASGWTCSTRTISYAASGTYGYGYGEITANGSGHSILGPTVSMDSGITVSDRIYVEAMVEASLNAVTASIDIGFEVFNASDVSQGVYYTNNSWVTSGGVQKRISAWLTPPAGVAGYKLRPIIRIASTYLASGTFRFTKYFARLYKAPTGGNSPQASYTLTPTYKEHAGSTAIITVSQTITNLLVNDFISVSISDGNYDGNWRITALDTANKKISFRTDMAYLQSSTAVTGSPSMSRVATILLHSWKDNGPVSEPGPATNWYQATSETIEYGLPPEVVIGGTSPDNTLHIKIPEQQPTFAQVTSTPPVARAVGDMWIDPGAPPAVESLVISSKTGSFNRGIEIYNTADTLVASIGPTGVVSLTGNPAYSAITNGHSLSGGWNSLWYNDSAVKFNIGGWTLTSGSTGSLVVPSSGYYSCSVRVESGSTSRTIYSVQGFFSESGYGGQEDWFFDYGGTGAGTTVTSGVRLAYLPSGRNLKPMVYSGVGSVTANIAINIWKIA